MWKNVENHGLWLAMWHSSFPIQRIFWVPNNSELPAPVASQVILCSKMLRSVHCLAKVLLCGRGLDPHGAQISHGMSFRDISISPLKQLDQWIAVAIQVLGCLGCISEIFVCLYLCWQKPSIPYSSWSLVGRGNPASEARFTVSGWSWKKPSFMPQFHTYVLSFHRKITLNRSTDARKLPWKSWKSGILDKDLLIEFYYACHKRKGIDPGFEAKTLKLVNLCEVE